MADNHPVAADDDQGGPEREGHHDVAEPAQERARSAETVGDDRRRQDQAACDPDVERSEKERILAEGSRTACDRYGRERDKDGETQPRQA
jgi:hypothetical protein